MAIVVVEPWKAAFEIHRRTIRAGHPVDLIPDFMIDLLRPADVITDEQIELAVVVIINPGAAGAPIRRRPANPGLRRHFRKFAAAEIMKEVVASDAGDEHVWPIIVVVVSHRDA